MCVRVADLPSTLLINLTTNNQHLTDNKQTIQQRTKHQATSNLYIVTLSSTENAGRILRVPVFNEQPIPDPPPLLSEPTIFKERMTQEDTYS